MIRGLNSDKTQGNGHRNDEYIEQALVIAHDEIGPAHINVVLSGYGKAYSHSL